MIGTDRQADLRAGLGRMIERGDELEGARRVAERDGKRAAAGQRRVIAAELAMKSWLDEIPAVERSGDARLGFGRGRDDLPGIVPRRIGFKAAFEGDMLEAEAQAADLVLRAERRRERDERAALHQEARRGAILDLDVVDAGGDAPEDGGDRPHPLGHTAL